MKERERLVFRSLCFGVSVESSRPHVRTTRFVTAIAAKKFFHEVDLDKAGSDDHDALSQRPRIVNKSILSFSFPTR